MDVVTLKILIVESNANEAKVLEDAFKRDGHSVFVAVDEMMARGLAHQHSVDAVVLEVGLVGGSQLARDLRRKHLPQHAVIVGLANRGSAIDPRDAETVDLHLDRPLEVTLLSGLLHFLRLQRMKGSATTRA